MSKSLYEKYAEEAQPEILSKTVSLEQAVEAIKGYQGLFSKEYLEWAEEICADMFGRTFEEVRDLVDGKQHWISIAGMYEDVSDKSFDSVHLFRGRVYVPYNYELDGCEGVSFMADAGNRLANLIPARLRSCEYFCDVQFDSITENGLMFVFDFSFCSGMDMNAIQRTLSGMFAGLKHSFYLDYNLDAKLSAATNRSKQAEHDDGKSLPDYVKD